MKNREIIWDDAIYFDDDGPYKKIYLTRGLFTKVDVWLFTLLNSRRWCVTRERDGLPYAQAKIGGEIVRMHRFILGLVKGQFVDHKNGNRLDNRRRNLRVATRDQNNRNSVSRRNTSSKYKGVCRTKSGRWQAQIKINSKAKYLGVFESRASNGEDVGEIMAAMVYDEAARKLHGEFARLNFPEKANVQDERGRTEISEEGATKDNFTEVAPAMGRDGEIDGRGDTGTVSSAGVLG